MSDYDLSVISPGDSGAQRRLEGLLARAGISLDPHLDYTVGLFGEDDELLATGSTYFNTLRCLAVEPSHQGEGLLARVMSFLTEKQLGRGYGEVFLYTKCDSARLFNDLGFSEIARVPEKLVFMSNRPLAFKKYLDALKRNAAVPGRAAAVVMNANPFTLGHLHLLERAAFENDVVHCFVVSEDVSLVPFRDRFDLVRKGCAHLANVMCHPSGSYIISNATFPSYFIKEEREVTETQARLDIEIFSRIAEALNIERRYVGEEPYSRITQAYNGVMAERLPEHGMELIVIPRLLTGGEAISASTVRSYIKDGKLEYIRPFVPFPTYAYFTSERGKDTVERIMRADDVVHA